PHGPYRFFRWVSGPGGVTYLGANQQGNGANPVELNLRGARAHYVAAFTTRDFTVITASRPGVGILVDGRPTFTPRHEDWPDDSAHTYAAEDSVDEVNGVRTRFQRWTRSGGAAQTITAELEFDYRTSSDLILSWPNSLTGIVRDAIRLYPLPA